MINLLLGALNHNTTTYLLLSSGNACVTLQFRTLDSPNLQLLRAQWAKKWINSPNVFLVTSSEKKEQHRFKTLSAFYLIMHTFV